MEKLVHPAPLLGTVFNCFCEMKATAEDICEPCDCKHCQFIPEFKALVVKVSPECRSTPLLRAEEIAEVMKIHPKLLPLELNMCGFPVHSVGKEIYLSPEAVWEYMDNYNVSLCELRLKSLICEPI